MARFGWKLPGSTRKQTYKFDVYLRLTESYLGTIEAYNYDKALELAATLYSLPVKNIRVQWSKYQRDY